MDYIQEKKNIQANPNGINLRIGLGLAHQPLTEPDVDAFITDQTILNTNQPVDKERTILRSYPWRYNTLSLQAYDQQNNLTSNYVDLFGVQAINSNSLGIDNSFFILDFYTDYNTSNQLKLYTGFKKVKLGQSVTSSSYIPIQILLTGSDYDTFCLIPNNYIQLFNPLYLSIRMFNGTTGQLVQFTNDINGSNYITLDVDYENGYYTPDPNGLTNISLTQVLQLTNNNTSPTSSQQPVVSVGTNATSGNLIDPLTGAYLITA